MTLGKTVGTGILGALIAFVFGLVFDKILFAWVYLAMPGADFFKVASVSTQIWSVIGIILLQLFYAFTYVILQRSIPGLKYAKGVLFGLMLWIVGVVPFSAMLLLNANINPIMPIYMLIAGLVQNVLIAVIYSGILTDNSEIFN
jgi:hypothetical protein